MEKHKDKYQRSPDNAALLWPQPGIAQTGDGERFPLFGLKTIGAAMIALSLLAACGGGGGGGTPQVDTTTPSTGGTTTTVALPAEVPASASMTMSCVDGAAFQCSGGSIIRTDNGVTLTSSGVQVYGQSTSDLATPIVVKTSASGFALASGGLAEIRVSKDSTGAVITPALLLSNLDLKWDGKLERPQIVETFRTTQARVRLNSAGALVFDTLPEPSDLGFYDFASKGVNGTQANYANNSYFPRSASNPPRCPPDFPSCPAVESRGLANKLGDWRTGGGTPDEVTVARLHEDGDIHAGNSSTNGFLPGGNGIGVPFPGSKGYRHFANYGFQYANLASWTSQDTVLIEEWANLGNEHNKNRRGMVSFGTVTDPGAVPASGTATYSGIAYGWYGRGALEEPPVFRGTATVTVNFATRQAVVTVQNTNTFDEAGTPVPSSFTATTGVGAAGAKVANYLTGVAGNATAAGGIGGRFYGPVVATGTSGAGPAEIGGAFRLANASGVAIVGGFIGRKQ